MRSDSSETSALRHSSDRRTEWREGKLHAVRRGRKKCVCATDLPDSYSMAGTGERLRACGVLASRELTATEDKIEKWYVLFPEEEKTSGEAQIMINK
jgi:hypothetical protein